VQKIKNKKLITYRAFADMMSFRIFSFRSLPPEKLVECDRKKARHREQKNKVGIRASRFPFGNGLNADVQIFRKLALSHPGCAPQAPYVATEWYIQSGKTSL